VKRQQAGKSNHANFARRMLAWYDRSRRDLPWRSPPQSPQLRPDPYQVLVSEFMLQQTQVATVIPYFHRFLAQFPTVQALAKADEQEVLLFWQGLGYYSRARNLLNCAKEIVFEFGGQVPTDLIDLQGLPGIGRYTAGAIASIAYDIPAPILDGNVARVLCRIHLIQSDPKDRATIANLWLKAEEMLPQRRAGDFNSALMELGAMICTPKSPKCLACPVRQDCRAAAAGLQETIPATRQRKPLPVERRWTLCIGHDNHWLIEQRPARGRWAGMWQFITIPSNGSATAAALSRDLKFKIMNLKSLGNIQHTLTHRQYSFDVFSASVRIRPEPIAKNRRWVSADQLCEFPLPKPHLKIAEMLKQQPLQ
jgi:A/G-specific adenine glycosylase